jgi:putative DNA primase/helicase
MAVPVLDAVTSFVSAFLPSHIVLGRSGPRDSKPSTDAISPTAPSGATVPFRPLGFQEFLNLGIPPREMLLSPVLPERSLSMLYAPRGIGKTLLALSIGLAVASGSNLLRWSVPKSRRVLYVDGEMILSDLQQRLSEISVGFGREIPDDAFRILAADHTEGGINLATPEGQAGIELLLEGVDLVILDNLSTLFPNGSENAGDAWEPMQSWLLKLRRSGKSVLFVHHAGNNGRQRGTSRREDVLDTVIGLRRPEDYSTEQGARFEIHYEKLRHRAEGAAPFEATANPLVSENGTAGLGWENRDLVPPMLMKAAALFEDGQTVREVAAILRISRSVAGRLRQRAVEEGLLEPEDGADQGEVSADNRSEPDLGIIRLVPRPTA